MTFVANFLANRTLANSGSSFAFQNTFASIISSASILRELPLGYDGFQQLRRGRIRMFHAQLYRQSQYTRLSQIRMDDASLGTYMT